MDDTLTSMRDDYWFALYRFGFISIDTYRCVYV